MVLIQYTNWGLANWYKDRIELNKNLKKYPNLHNYVLSHEKKHKEGFDLINDIKPSILTLSLILFCLRYPKTLIDLSPIWIKNKKIEYDKNKILLYIFFISLSLILWVIIKKAGIFNP